MEDESWSRRLPDVKVEVGCDNVYVASILSVTHDNVLLKTEFNQEDEDIFQNVHNDKLLMGDDGHTESSKALYRNNREHVPDDMLVVSQAFKVEADVVEGVGVKTEPTAMDTGGSQQSGAGNEQDGSLGQPIEPTEENNGCLVQAMSQPMLLTVVEKSSEVPMVGVETSTATDHESPQNPGPKIQENAKTEVTLQRRTRDKSSTIPEAVDNDVDEVSMLEPLDLHQSSPSDSERDTDKADEKSSDGSASAGQKHDKSSKKCGSEQYQRITLPLYKSEDGKRDYAKKDHCVFCGHMYKSKMSSHLVTVHVDEAAVKAILRLPVGSKERKAAWMILQNEGNFKHNLKVIELGEGELVVARRLKESTKPKFGAKDYLPCEYCLAFQQKHCLWSHVENCPAKPVEEQPVRNYVRNGLTLLAPFLHDRSMRKEMAEIFSHMKETRSNPGVRAICEKDDLIRKFAQCLIGKMGPRSEQKKKDRSNISTKLRTVGRLLKALNAKIGEARPLKYFISGPGFPQVLEAVRALSLKARYPGLALRLGSYIRQINLLKLTVALHENDSKMRTEARAFKQLYETSWCSKISRMANRQQTMKTLNKTNPVPETDDLAKLAEFLVLSISESIEISEPSLVQWTKVAQTVLVRVVTFNRRRISEVEELTVADYSNRPNVQDLPELLKSLDVAARALAERMTLIQVDLQRPCDVPSVFMLLTKDMCQGIEWLLNTRQSVGIDSVYLFARTAKAPLDGCKALKALTRQCPGLANPNSIQAPKLGTYIGTTTQLLSMNCAELKTLADHLGRSVNILVDVRRMLSAPLERSKVARILIAVENGSIDTFRGRDLNDIPEDSLPVPFSYSDDQCSTPDKSSVSSDEVRESHHLVSRAVQTECDISTGRFEELRPAKAIVERQKGREKAPWTPAENDAFKEAFRCQLVRKQNVSTEEIREAQKQYPLLQKRSIPLIRSKVNNVIMGKIKSFRLP